MKTALAESTKRLHTGRRVLTAPIEEARRKLAKRLYLETKHVLSPVVHLYEALGFTHIPKRKADVFTYALADMFIEMWPG